MEIISTSLNINNIQKTPGVCGGNARIRDTRIPVWSLVSFHQQGAPDDYLLRNYPGLTQEDLQAAWSYYNQHREEIDRVIADDDEDDD
jgi:type III restriction enzyme